MSSKHKQLAIRIQEEVFGAGRLEVIDELYAAPLVERVKKLVGLLRGAFPDLAIQIDHLIAEDGKVACRWSATGTQKDWFHNVPPSGARVTWTGTSFYVFEEGGDKVAAVTSNWDLFGLLQQLRAALR